MKIPSGLLAGLLRCAENRLHSEVSASANVWMIDVPDCAANFLVSLVPENNVVGDWIRNQISEIANSSEILDVKPLVIDPPPEIPPEEEPPIDEPPTEDPPVEDPPIEETP